MVLFVLTQLPTGKQIILLSSDLNLTGAEVIEVYGWRFKIEVSFRTLIQLLGGFCYRFWLKSMKTVSKWPQNLTLANYDEDFQRQVTRKVETFERFINLNAIAFRSATSTCTRNAQSRLDALSTLGFAPYQSTVIRANRLCDSHSKINKR